MNYFARHKRLDIIIAISIGIVWFSLSVAFRAQQYSYDSLMFGSAINAGEYAPGVWRPHNLIYLPLAILLRNSCEAIGLSPSPLVIGVLVSAFWGALAIGLLWLVARRFLRPPTAALTTVFFATTNAVASQSQTIEVYTVGLTFVVAMIYALWRSNPNPWLVGFLWAGAVLGHLTNVLLAIPFLAYCLAFGGKERVRFFLLVSIIGGTLTLLVYTFIAFAVVGVDSLRGFLRWVISYTSSAQQYGIWSREQMALGPVGLKEAMVVGAGWRATIHFLLILLSMVLTFFGEGVYRRACLVMLSFAGTYAVFFTWWEPLNIEFWVVTMAPLILLLALTIAGLRVRLTRLLLWSLLALAFLIQFTANGRNSLRLTDPSGDFWMERARTLAPYLNEKDVIFTFNDPIVYTMPLATSHRYAFALDLMAGASEADFDRALVYTKLVADDLRGQGGQVYFTVDGFNPPQLLLNRLGVSLEEYQQRIRETLEQDLNDLYAEGLLVR